MELQLPLTLTDEQDMGAVRWLKLSLLWGLPSIPITVKGGSRLNKGN